MTQGLSITAIGLCWSTEPNPKADGFHMYTTNWSEPYVCTITGLEPNTKYYVRAYALRGLEYYYGTEWSFTTRNGDVLVTTHTPEHITPESAVCGCDAIVMQGLTLNEMGVCISTESHPVVEGFHFATFDCNEPFVCTFRNLVPETRYFVRAYAIQGLECYYGEEKSFITDNWGDGIDNPIISVIQGEGFIQDGYVLESNVVYWYGFRMSSNTNSMKELATFRLEAKYLDMNGSVISVEDNTYNIGDFEYIFEDNVIFNPRELVGQFILTATVTDVVGNSSCTSIHVYFDQQSVALDVEDIVWVKSGNNTQDLSAYGLVWHPLNFKSPFTHIVPAEGCTLYLVENGDEDFAEIVTDVDLFAYCSILIETARPIDDYNKVDCNNSANYHDLLITLDSEGKLHAIHITHADIAIHADGLRITITGMAK